MSETALFQSKFSITVSFRAMRWALCVGVTDCGYVSGSRDTYTFVSKFVCYEYYAWWILCLIAETRIRPYKMSHFGNHIHWVSILSLWFYLYYVERPLIKRSILLFIFLMTLTQDIRFVHNKLLLPVLICLC